MALYRLEARGPGAGGDFWSTSMHLVSARSITLVHTTWETFLNSFVGGTLAPIWPDDQQCNQAITTLINEANGKNVSRVQSTVNHPGTGVGGTLSQRDCITVGLKDGTPTRSGRGRMYWPPPAAGSLDADGLILPATAASIASGFKAAVDALDVADQLVIYHRPVKAGPGGVPPAVNGSVTSVVNITVGIIPTTQRRRTNRVTNAYTVLPV